jgi:site-specific DNA-methyltransferase (adenine-specific)
MNKLFFGDNLPWLRKKEFFPDASVDLIYLDPPFNSNADYNVLFKEDSGEVSQAQFHAFTDTWHWVDAAETYNHFIDECQNTTVVDMMQSLYGFLRASPMMAYLAMMAPRLVELHRVLKPTGSLYLHCDPTASHYLKLILDGIFGMENFVNEIVWQRSGAHNMKTKGFVRVNDILLFYAKSDRFFFSEQYTPYGPEQMSRYKADEKGRLYKAENLTFSTASPSRQFEWRGQKPPPNRSWGASLEQLEKWLAEGRILLRKDGAPRMDGLKIYLDETKGTPLTTNWTDIKRIGNTSEERLHYQTQKPQALLERIISASSNKGDIVLDPFCGCGTTVHAAQKLERTWIGIDITYLAINLIKHRLEDAFGESVKYEERGQPTDYASAKALAELDKWQFQQWALSLIDARPRTIGDGKGADRGVDGMLYFYEDADARQKILVQVKGGGVNRGDVATLLGDVNNQKFVAGILLTLEKPSKPMQLEAAEAGRYKSKIWHKKDYPKIQILTIEGLMDGVERVDAPPQDNPFAKAQRESKPERQDGLKL